MYINMHKVQKLKECTGIETEVGILRLFLFSQLWALENHPLASCAVGPGGWNIPTNWWEVCFLPVLLMKVSYSLLLVCFLRINFPPSMVWLLQSWQPVLQGFLFCFVFKLNLHLQHHSLKIYTQNPGRGMITNHFLPLCMQRVTNAKVGISHCHLWTSRWLSYNTLWGFF